MAIDNMEPMVEARGPIGTEDDFVQLDRSDSPVLDRLEGNFDDDLSEVNKLLSSSDDALIGLTIFWRKAFHPQSQVRRCTIELQRTLYILPLHNLGIHQFSLKR